MKHFYLEFVSLHLRSEFPRLVSYQHSVEFERDALVPLAAYLQSRRGSCMGISFIDSTALAVCANLRIPRYRQFNWIALRGKTTWAGFTVSNCTLLSQIVATREIETCAIAEYERRWGTETLFGCLKSRGFDFEETHLAKRSRISV